MVQFDSHGHYTNGERFLAFARNDKQNSGPVISNEVRDLSELNHTKDSVVLTKWRGLK
jgi:hypothetical protein